LWALFAAVITATVTGIAILLQLGAASKERLEAIYERLLSELNNVVREMGDWDGKKKNLPQDKKRTISRMLHLHLDSLVESIAVEGRSRWRGFWYRLGIGRLMYQRVGEKWFLERHRYQRLENWYAGTLVLYNRTLGGSNYVEEVFHPKKIERDPHRGIKSLEQYFEKRLNAEKGKGRWMKK